MAAIKKIRTVISLGTKPFKKGLKKNMNIKAEIKKGYLLIIAAFILMPFKKLIVSN